MSTKCCQWEWKNWYSFLLSTEIHQWFWLLIESKLTQWNINKHIFITTKMMNKKFMFWLLWMKVDEKIIKLWEKMKMISSIEIIRLWFQIMMKWMIWWVENENKLKKWNKNLIELIIVYFWFIFDCFVHFSFYFLENQKDKENEQKNETQQRIIDPYVFQYLWNLMIKIYFLFFISFYHFMTITYIVY